MLEQYEAEKKNERRAVNNIFRAAAIEKDSKKWLYMLGTDIPRKEIISIKFENTLERKSGRYWDISAKRDESVIGCAEKKETGYDFYIAANGKIIGNPDCKNLFRACECLVNIKFNGNFDTSYVTNMEYMFYDCFSLEELDIISLDTSQVTNMKGMFAECSCLTELRIDSFKTSNVIDMAGMFRNCKREKPLTRNRYSMRGYYFYYISGYYYGKTRKILGCIRRKKRFRNGLGGKEDGWL